jgi:phage terminase large subunit-like protein
MSSSSLLETVLRKVGATRLVEALTPEERLRLRFEWSAWARPEQLEPTGGWLTWLILSGRGWGKTRTGAEWVREQVEVGGRRRLALIARTSADARDVIVEGESGIMAVCPPWNRPLYEPSKRRLTWPGGAIATVYSADEPDLLRGPQHDGAWCDELASWERPEEVWDNLMFGLRLGERPRVVVTTTPRPIPLIRKLISDRTTHITRGSTFDNQRNLAASQIARLREKYEGTRIARQEIYGEVLDDVPGALWTREMLDTGRVKEAPELVRVVVAIDPAVTSGEDSDETGIVVAGRARNGHLYVLRDATCKLTPSGWARRAVAAFDEFQADRIVAEVNQGGDLVEQTIRTVRQSIPFAKVHATRGKRVRAEPVGALYEQGKVHHVGGFAELEDQMCQFAPDNFIGSPDRVDALVWGLSELSGGSVVSMEGLTAENRPKFPTRDVCAPARAGGHWLSSKYAPDHWPEDDGQVRNPWTSR